MKIVVNLQSLCVNVPGLTQKDIDEGNLDKVQKALDKKFDGAKTFLPLIESVEEV